MPRHTGDVGVGEPAPNRAPFGDGCGARAIEGEVVGGQVIDSAGFFWRLMRAIGPVMSMRPVSGRPGRVGVQNLDAGRRAAAVGRLARPLLMGWALLTTQGAHARVEPPTIVPPSAAPKATQPPAAAGRPGLGAAPTGRAPEVDEPGDGPQYPELANGTSAVWADVGGVAGWLTQRSPLADFTPLVLGLGFSHTVGPARVAWRATLFTGLGDDAPRFIYLDLLSIERVYAGLPVVPWWRIGLGFGLDLRGPKRSLGSEGYFNADNGAAGGIGVLVGGGLDVELGDVVFLRLDTSLRAYGAAGRSGAFWVATVGPGFRF